MRRPMQMSSSGVDCQEQERGALECGGGEMMEDSRWNVLAEDQLLAHQDYVAWYL